MVLIMTLLFRFIYKEALIGAIFCGVLTFSLISFLVSALIKCIGFIVKWSKLAKFPRLLTYVPLTWPFSTNHQNERFCLRRGLCSNCVLYVLFYFNDNLNALHHDHQLRFILLQPSTTWSSGDFLFGQLCISLPVIFDVALQSLVRMKSYHPGCCRMRVALKRKPFLWPPWS